MAMSQSQKASGQFSYDEKLLPQAEMLEEKKDKRPLFIGIPKETDKYENRIILTPQAVKQLTDEGHNIVIESGAGIKSRWKDNDYTGAGATIKSRKEIFKSEIILKVSPFEEEDIKLLTGSQLVISALHFNTQTSQKINHLKYKKVSAVAIELMKAIWKNEIVAESGDTLVIEGNHYFPQNSVNYDYLSLSERAGVNPWKGTVNYYNLEVAGEKNPNAAWYYPNPENAAKEITRYIAFWKGIQIVDN